MRSVIDPGSLTKEQVLVDRRAATQKTWYILNMIDHNLADESHPGHRRTFREELLRWRAWRDQSPVYQKRKWDSLRPIFGIIAFALERKWLSQEFTWILFVFVVEILALAPLQFITGDRPGISVVADFLLIVVTLAYLEYRVWSRSKLVFALFLPMLLMAVCCGKPLADPLAGRSMRLAIASRRRRLFPLSVVPHSREKCRL
jgi:hypothetical protein